MAKNLKSRAQHVEEAWWYVLEAAGHKVATGSQEAEGEGVWHSPIFLLFIQSRTPARGIVLFLFGVGFLYPPKCLLRPPSQMHPDVCFHWNSSLPQVGKIHLHQGLRSDYENSMHKGEEQRWKPPGVLYHPTHVVAALTCLLGVGGSLCQGCPCLPDSIPSVLLMVCMRCI